MASPFPGMNPYLENSELWSAVHSRLIVAIADALADLVSQEYRIEIEKRTYWSEPAPADLLIGIPDVSVLAGKVPNTSNNVELASTPTITELRSIQPQKILLPVPEEVSDRYLEIKEVRTGKVITVIELLSPKSKRAGEGRDSYLQKRRQVLTSQTHLIEIDLLRGGKSLLSENIDLNHYYIVISRSHERPSAEFYPFSVRDRIPNFPIPLLAGEAEPYLDLQSLVNQIYDRGRYALAIDYSKPPQPPLSEIDAAWAKSLLSQ